MLDQSGRKKAGHCLVSFNFQLRQYKKKKKKGIRRKECMHSFAIASITTEKCV